MFEVGAEATWRRQRFSRRRVERSRASGSPPATRRRSNHTIGSPDVRPSAAAISAVAGMLGGLEDAALLLQPGRHDGPGQPGRPDDGLVQVAAYDEGPAAAPGVEQTLLPEAPDGLPDRGPADLELGRQVGLGREALGVRARQQPVTKQTAELSPQWQRLPRVEARVGDMRSATLLSRPVGTEVVGSLTRRCRRGRTSGRTAITAAPTPAIFQSPWRRQAITAAATAAIGVHTRSPRPASTTARPEPLAKPWRTWATPWGNVPPDNVVRALPRRRGLLDHHAGGDQHQAGHQTDPQHPGHEVLERHAPTALISIWTATTARTTTNVQRMIDGPNFVNRRPPSHAPASTPSATGPARYGSTPPLAR